MRLSWLQLDTEPRSGNGVDVYDCVSLLLLSQLIYQRCIKQRPSIDESCHLLGYNAVQNSLQPPAAVWFLVPLSFFTLKTEMIRSSETWVHIRTRRRYIPEDGNINNYCCELQILQITDPVKQKATKEI
jgi:hypothetical protein